jgi:Kef-type K+ transport system membrane component KefB
MIAKVIGVWPICRLFRMPARESNYTTLMMATGLTFGSISALFGYSYGYIDQAQYSILVTVVIASAVIPTIFAQVFFQPREVSLGKGAELVYHGTTEHYLHMPEE